MVPILCSLRKMRQAGDWPTAIKAVVLSPTNELAAQQARCLKLLLPGSGLRGSLLSKATAAGSDFSKVDILLANPLRLLSLIEAKKVDLSEVGLAALRCAGSSLVYSGPRDQVAGQQQAACGCARHSARCSRPQSTCNWMLVSLHAVASVLSPDSWDSID